MNLLLRISCCVLFSASLGSCSAYKKNAKADDPRPGAAATTGAPVKTVANKAYRTPTLQGPAPRNPDVNLSAGFSAGAGVTHSRGPADKPFVAITFDDGPNPQHTPRLLDMLRQRNIKATFYVIGRNVEMYPEIVRRTVAEGHEIGNHTFSHRLLTKMGDSEVLRELSRTRDAISAAAGVQPRTMRPPYGGLLQRQRELVHNQFGYPTVLWSVDPRDWQRPGTSVVASRIVTGASNGSIILAHDLHGPTVDAMPAALDGLLRKGYRFVTVSQMIALQEAATLAAAQT